MKRKVAPRKGPHELPDNQRYLFHAIGIALKHANRRHTYTHADLLRVLEEYRHILTEDWIEKHPETIGNISKFIGKE